MIIWNNTQAIFKHYRPLVPSIKEKFDEDNLAFDRHYTHTNVQIIKQDTLDCAKEMDRPLVLILADDVNPGGCVAAGAGMQEESLFRRSALHKHLIKDLYPIMHDELIYVPDVALTDDTSMNFIACPGIKMPRLTENNRLLPDDEILLERKIQLIFQVAYKYGYSNLVLGALGCGVWGCPAKHVAQIFKRAIAKYDGVFNEIRFAILWANYNIFSDVFADPALRSS